LGLAGFLQPVVKFNHGFCGYDCTICAEVCPSHALDEFMMKKKHVVQIGEVVFLQENCVVETQGTNCGACGEHCPTGAITMVPFGDPAGLLAIPKIDKTLCIGCGACEYICPVSPYKAIYVKGLATQGTAKLAYDPNEKQQEVKLDDFGF
jgi:ferredoxin